MDNLFGNPVITLRFIPAFVLDPAFILIKNHTSTSEQRGQTDGRPGFKTGEVGQQFADGYETRFDQIGFA
jgi:hypothetical protein